jgi:DNA polymerase-3 subunit beta
MLLKVEKNVVEKVLYYLQNIVEKKTTMPILSHCYLNIDKNSTEIYATDLEISYISKIESSSDEKARLVVPARKLYEIIKEMPVKIINIKSEENNWVNIFSEKNISFKIAGLNPDDFPNIQRFSDTKFSDMDCTILNEMIDSTIYAVSTDETRFNLTGVFLEISSVKDEKKLTMVATDGHRLALNENTIKNLDLKLQKGIIIPKKGLMELKKLIEKSKTVGIAVKDNHFVAKVDDSILAMRLIDADFPDYKGVIPKSSKRKSEITRESMLGALKRSVIMLSSGKFQGIKLKLENNKMELYANNPDVGSFQEEIDVSYTGEKIEIGFNAAYLIDALNSFADKEISFELEDEFNPCVIQRKKDKKDETRKLAVIMPMRL